MNVKTKENPEYDKFNDEPIIVNPGNGEKLKAPGVTCTFKITSDITKDKIGIYEIALQPKTNGANLHFHRFMDETFIVLQGTVTVQMKEKEIEAKKGSIIYIPRFTPHGFGNTSDKVAKLMLVFNPGQQREGFFHGLYNQLSKDTIDDEIITSLNERFDNIPIK